MPSGHTDRATINERCKLSPHMLALLRQLGKQRIHIVDISNGNRMRGLMDRGYAIPDGGGHWWLITEQGNERLRQEGG